MTEGSEFIARKYWQHPWGIKESFVICLALLIAGLALDALIYPDTLFIPKWPANLVFLILLTGLILIISFFRKSEFFKWASGAKSAVVCIASISVILILMGLIPQQNNSEDSGFLSRIGVFNLVHSSAFLLLCTWLLILLGMVTIRKMSGFNYRTISFFMNHAGLWLIIAGGMAGSGDSITLEMTVKEGNTNWIAYSSETKKYYELPLAIELEDFLLEEYAPILGLIDSSSAEFIQSPGDKPLIAEEGNTGHIGNYRVEVISVLPYADGTDSVFYPMVVPGAAWAAELEASHLMTDSIYRGWVSCGSYRIAPRFLNSGNGNLIAMLPPSPRKFQSDVKVYTKDGEATAASIQVNKPVTAGRWKIYQSSYDNRLGRDSDISVLKLVSDPWLPVVYAGFVMLLVGSVLLFWAGKKTKTE